ncbi:MAG: hypothetical protein LBU14_05730 [Candidatus Peribacteria bacterium]|jgi:radical SAM superfamily enzyme YgiQ (UPF0313 family)|nr:hypothetical protein [Candidatus Peribacteria bacterium]
MEYLYKNYSIKKFKLFIPTLTIDKKWVENFCNLLITKNLNIKWTSTTRLDCNNDEKLIELMSRSGCYKIAIGVETNDKESNEVIKKYKNLKYLNDLEETIKLYVKYNIVFKSLIML